MAKENPIKMRLEFVSKCRENKSYSLDIFMYDYLKF